MQTIEKTIEVERPVNAVYDQWTRFEEFPKFMKGIKEVKLANLFGVKDAPEGFIAWALKNGAVSIESDTEWNEAIQKAEGK